MATAKRRKQTKKVEAKKTTNKERLTAKRQITAVILFGVGIFLAAVVFIPGENFWNLMQKFLFGLFGVLTYLIPFYLILIAVLCTLDRLNRNVKIKTILSGIVVALTLGVIDVFTTQSPLMPFFAHLGDAYKRGVLSGGFVGAFVGHPIAAAFGKTGAAITIILSIPTMLASFWGMNVNLPLKDNVFGFWYVIALSTILTILVILFFSIFTHFCQVSFRYLSLFLSFFSRDLTPHEMRRTITRYVSASIR